ncbi:MAG: FadR family transcriptional regulator [Desulfuromonadales bacterium]|nr:FadR family transcriptional regulator [Desulfuromonadales bacterium]
MTPLFKPIRPKKIAEEIVIQIKNLIARGQLKPGQKVPSERELAAMLGVSRPSVREAITVLEAMGMVESRQGGGTFVRSLTEMTITEPLSTMVENDPRLLHALAEVRVGLESWSAYLAAGRATEEDIAQLRGFVDEMDRQAVRGVWDADIDASFHYAITAAAHNTIQLHVLDSIQSLFHATIQAALKEFYRSPEAVETLRHHHRTILEAIARHDPEGARQAMLNHLKMVEAKMAQLEERQR